MKTRMIPCGPFFPAAVPENGESVETLEDVKHGDWKTAAVFPERWPSIPKGTTLTVLDAFWCYDGIHLKVKYGDQTYDIPHHKTKHVPKPEEQKT